MLKYVNTGVVFQEIPDEVTLAINISNCPCRCPGCHSSYLWQNVGTPLTAMELDNLICQYEAEITCVAFMGGDSEPEYINNLARFIHREHPELKVAWYSGRQRVAPQVKRTDFDYTSAAAAAQASSIITLKAKAIVLFIVQSSFCFSSG